MYILEAYEVNKDIKPMDEETKKWLTEAFEEYSKDEVSEIVIK